MSLLRNAAGLLLTNAVLVPIGVIGSIVLARALSVEDRGVYALVMTFATTVSMLGLLGWPTAATYRIKRALAPADRVAGAGLVGMTAIAAAIAALGLACAPVIMARFFVGAPAAALHAALAFVAVRMLGTLGGNLARGVDRFRYANWHELVSVGGIPVLALALLVGLDVGLLPFLHAVLLFQASATIALLVAVCRVTGFALTRPLGESMAALRFGLRSWLTSISGQLHEQIDVFMLIALLADAEAVAYYAIAANVAQRLKLLPEALGTAAFPELASLDPAAGAALTAGIARRSLLLVAAAAGALMGLAPWLVPALFGAAYSESVAPLLLLLPAVTFLALYRIVFRYFVALDRQTPNIATQLVSLGTNVALNALWIPQHGIAGAAAASLVSYALEAVLIAIVFTRATGTPFSALLVPRAADFTSLVAQLRRLASRDRG